MIANALRFCIEDVRCRKNLNVLPLGITANPIKIYSRVSSFMTATNANTCISYYILIVDRHN